MTSRLVVSGHAVTWTRSKFSLGRSILVAEIGLIHAETGGRTFSDLIFWKSGNHVCGQFVDADDEWGDYFSSGEFLRRGNRLVGCFSKREGNWEYPLVQVFRLSQNRWKKTTEDADYNPELLVALRAPNFLRLNGIAHQDLISVTIRKYPSHLSQPHAGPLLNARSTWKVIHFGCVPSTSLHLVPTPFAKLDQIAGEAQDSRRKAFNIDVPARWRSLLWIVLKRGSTTAFSLQGRRKPKRRCSPVFRHLNLELVQMTS